MRPSRTQRQAFSLVELLVVIGIIAILIALLLPVLSRARHAGRNTVCLATLHDWGHAFRMYADANRGRAPALGPIPDNIRDRGMPPLWWEQLQPYHGGDVARSLLCPEATEEANVDPKNSFQAWGPQYVFDAGRKVRGPFVGSYAFNGWLLDFAADQSPMNDRDPTAVPVIADGAAMFVWPRDTDPPARYEKNASPNIGLRGAALERHDGTGVHVAFLDGHTAHVTVAELWRQHWSRSFVPRNVTIPR
jgi:prepilin-type N-terminal cleavage/methylation domain-containing protein/prepilin-type processing-associated H-X9-DG protein